MGSDVINLLALFSTFLSVVDSVQQMTVLVTPPCSKFGPAGVLRDTDLDDVLAASLGYTPVKSSPWDGLVILSPFNTPLAAVVVEIRSGGAAIQLEGSTYELHEDTTLDEVFDRLKLVYGPRSQRPTIFERLTVDNVVDIHGNCALPDASELDVTQDLDAAFLKDMPALVLKAKTVEAITSTPIGGQDVIFLEVLSFELLVKTYGLNSPQVKEAVGIIQNHLATVTEVLRQVYGDRVLFIVVTSVDKLNKQLILQTIKENDLNIALYYTETFPAMFNITLWFSVILSAVLLISFVEVISAVDSLQHFRAYNRLVIKHNKDV